MSRLSSKKMLAPYPVRFLFYLSWSREYRLALLLVLVAIFISLIGPAGYDRQPAGRSMPAEPLFDVLIASVGEELEHTIDPRRAVFLFLPIDLNLADVEVLSSLKGIGPKLAGRIIAWRDQHGGFKEVAELLEVKGIGERKLAAIVSEVTVGERGNMFTVVPDVS
jgi:competence ComEA-like helix-hairpin-helix protein